MNELQTEFHADHQVLTKGLHEIRQALSRGQVDEATSAARALDAAAGPHIEFEEEYFYPRLRPELGEDFVDQLYAEHAEGRAAIASLAAHPRGEPLAPEQQVLIARQLDIAVRHARSCGTLLGRLATFGEQSQGQLLVQLRQLRREGRPWSLLGTDRGGG